MPPPAGRAPAREEVRRVGHDRNASFQGPDLLGYGLLAALLGTLLAVRPDVT